MGWTSSKSDAAGFVRARERMVERQLARRGVRSPHVLEAMRRVPREAFVAPGFEDLAYADRALPTFAGQTISQPYVVALMIEAAEAKPGDDVLEVGAGTGYAAAVLAEIAGRVCAIERHAALGEAARERLKRLGYGDVQFRIGDGSIGWPEAAPFDAIVVSAGAPGVPAALKRQLAVGGRLVVPVGPAETRQHLLKVIRRGEDEFEQQDLGAVRFVPLIGEQGWSEEGRPAGDARWRRRGEG